MRKTGLVLLVASALAVVAGTFVELYELRMILPGNEHVDAMNGWLYLRRPVDDAPDAFPTRYGPPAAVSAALIALAVVLLARANERGRAVAVAGVAGLVVSVWAAAELYLSVLSYLPALKNEFPADVTAGGALPVLGAGAVVAVAGLFLALRRVPQPAEQQDLEDDTPTPPYGVPVQENP